MRARTVLAAGVTALGLAAATSSADAAGRPAESAGQIVTAGGCSWTSHVSLAPGLTLSAKDFTFGLDGLLGPCKMPDGETRTARITVTKGTGHGGCGSARVETPLSVSWDGGRTRSRGHAAGITSGPFGAVAGTLHGGDYAGTPFQALIVLNPRGPLQCGTTGITAAELYGQITFR